MTKWTRCGLCEHLVRLWFAYFTQEPVLLPNYTYLDPVDRLDSLQKNPEMMKMGMDQMKNATPEQMAQQARMAQAKMASNKPAASKKPLKLKGEGKPAEVLKNEGNGFYAAQQFGEAVKKYEAALVVRATSACTHAHCNCLLRENDGTCCCHASMMRLMRWF